MCVYYCSTYYKAVRVGGGLFFCLSNTGTAVMNTHIHSLSVFQTLSPSRERESVSKLFAWAGGETMEGMCYERLRAEDCVD